MRWQGRRESDNVEDRRDDSGGSDGSGGGGFGIPFPGGGGGGGGFQIPMGEGGGVGIIGVIVIVGIALLLGVDPRVLLNGGGGIEMPGGGRQIQLPNDRQPRVVRHRQAEVEAQLPNHPRREDGLLRICAAAGVIE